jgi:hypothetical protein
MGVLFYFVLGSLLVGVFDENSGFGEKEVQARIV